jgi:hypothetical protein
MKLGCNVEVVLSVDDTVRIPNVLGLTTDIPVQLNVVKQIRNPLLTKYG